MLSNFVNTKFLYFENTTRIAKLALALASSFVVGRKQCNFSFSQTTNVLKVQMVAMAERHFLVN